MTASRSQSYSLSGAVLLASLMTRDGQLRVDKDKVVPDSYRLMV